MNSAKSAIKRTPNKAKGQSYAEAWRRIKQANENGYHFEAVAICESIISDRLLSYVLGKAPDSSANTRTALFDLIAEWRRLSAPKNKTTIAEYAETLLLIQKVDDWRIERNTVLHGLVKSMPGTATPEVEPVILKARKTANNGAALARAVLVWHRKQLPNNQTEA
jgi:predicted type IV restriction endonuclease